MDETQAPPNPHAQWGLTEKEKKKGKKSDTKRKATFKRKRSKRACKGDAAEEEKKEEGDAAEDEKKEDKHMYRNVMHPASNVAHACELLEERGWTDDDAPEMAQTLVDLKMPIAAYPQGPMKGKFSYLLYGDGEVKIEVGLKKCSFRVMKSHVDGGEFTAARSHLWNRFNNLVEAFAHVKNLTHFDGMDTPGRS